MKIIALFLGIASAHKLRGDDSGLNGNGTKQTNLSGVDIYEDLPDWHVPK